MDSSSLPKATDYTRKSCLISLLEVRVEEYVVAEQFEAVASVDAALTDLSLRLLVDAHYALDYYVVEFGPHEFAVNSFGFEVRLEGTETPFEATVIIVCILVLDVVFVVLIDRVVRQVTKLGLFILKDVI